MNQPTKDTLREQLALAADEIIRLRTLLIGGLTSEQIAARQRGLARRCREQAAQALTRMEAPSPWWRRLFS